VVIRFFSTRLRRQAMWETELHTASIRGARRFAQTGFAAVEFALVALIFFTLVFGIIELARVMYMYNTLAEATRRAANAAANIDFRDSTALDHARQQAIFRDSPGTLFVGEPISDQNVRIDYLYLAKQGNGTLAMTPIPSGSLPSCPSRNRQNCLANPYDSSCIRLVRARICEPGTDVCDRVQYRPLIRLIPLDLPLPSSTTIVNAETLGYSAGDALCP
jgi:Flp pilus assembly protein TadG